MTTPEQAVQAYIKAFGNTPRTKAMALKNEQKVRHALTAAAPHLAAVRVKKLEWSEPYKNVLKAETVNGRWAIQFTAGKWDWWSPQYDDDSFAPKQFDTLEDAKAAAQADYEARILSALEPSAGRAAVLEEAARVAEERAKHTTGCNPYYVAIGIAEAIRALHPVADKPDEAGAQGEGWLPMKHPDTPRDGTEILAWRKDCGQFIASYTSCSAFPMSEAELDLMDEDTLFKEDWFTQWPQALRLEGSEVPTHWRPLPSAPASEGAE